MEDIQTTSSQTVFKTGEKINITWTPNQLTEDILSGDSTVDIAMVCIMQGYIQKFMLGGANYEQVGFFVAAI